MKAKTESPAEGVRVWGHNFATVLLASATKFLHLSDCMFSITSFFSSSWWLKHIYIVWLVIITRRDELQPTDLLHLIFLYLCLSTFHNTYFLPSRYVVVNSFGPTLLLILVSQPVVWYIDEFLLRSCQSFGPTRCETRLYQGHYYNSPREGQKADSSAHHRDLEMYGVHIF